MDKPHIDKLHMDKLMAVLFAVLGTLALAGRSMASDATADYQRVFQGNDATAKRQLLRQWADRSTGDDDVILPLLVAAVGDRQTHDEAVAALRARTGLTPPKYQGQSHYPAYPPSDHPQSWQYWLADRQRERDQDARIATALAHARAARDAADDAAAAVDAKPASSPSPGTPAH